MPITRRRLLQAFLLLAMIISGCSMTTDESKQSIPAATAGGEGSAIQFTPAQAEGPYYPVEKPADRDSDLLSVSGSTERPAGEVLSLAGIVYDRDGQPVNGAVVEIWQTDSSGAYLHPEDPNTDRRDLNFQFYGESETGSDGVYSFRTLLPGLYGNRPRHIHVKVRVGGDVVLTTQFYFANEVALTGVDAMLLVELVPAENDEGAPIWVGARDIVLDLQR